MTATVHQLPDRDTVRGKVATEVRGELAKARISGNKLPGLIGKSQSYWSRRLTGERPFDVDELEKIAALVGVTVDRFFVTANNRPTSPNGALPRLDSNQQPFDYRPVEPEHDAVILSFRRHADRGVKQSA